jgi:hypothetical protein
MRKGKKVRFCRKIGKRDINDSKGVEFINFIYERERERERE